MLGRNGQRGETHALETIIGEGTRVEGGLTSPGSVRVDGVVNGPVTGKTIFIGTKAMVRGDLSARSAIIGGTVYGGVAAENVDIKSGARVVGDLKTRTLSVAEGAVFEGRCSMNHESEPSSSPAEASSVNQPSLL